MMRQKTGTRFINSWLGHSSLRCNAWERWTDREIKVPNDPAVKLARMRLWTDWWAKAYTYINHPILQL